MKNFFFSYHSIGVFLVFLIVLIQTIYLIFKKDKKTPTYWLIGLFAGFSVMLFGYFLAYSIYDPIGAYHRYFTVFVLFANANMTGFAYSFPRNEFKEEEKYAVPSAFIIAVIGYLHFIYKTLGTEKFYNFTAHFYNFDFGATTSVFILILFLWPLIVLIRKTILYSSYDGNLLNNLKSDNSMNSKIYNSLLYFLVGFIKLIKPKGDSANYVRTFVVVILLLIVAAVSNILNKNGILPYDYYAIFYSNSVMVICFVLLMAYINSSGEPTTFMIKLVGISLITVLLILGVLSNFALSLSETDYDNQRMSEINAYKENILKNDYSDFPNEIYYVLRTKSGIDVTDLDYEKELLFIKEGLYLTEEMIKAGDERDLNLRIKEKYNQIRNINKFKFDDEIKNLAILEYKKSRQYKNILDSQKEIRTRHYREAGDNYLYYDFDHKDMRYEIGYRYLDYRKHTHKNAKFLFYLVMISTILIIVIFPKFFKSSLVKPLNNLLDGVHRVNSGDLDVHVSIKVQDEIGFLADSFNSMVSSIKDARQELQDYASNLESKVLERTKEVQDKMNEVNTLKIQQDGDYFLTSLLARPLFVNANKSSIVLTDFYISQKKKFEFRNKKAELGGDICTTGYIKLGSQRKNKSYVIAVNGDAMGKSMQGAGGSLVMGVVINSIIARSSGDKVVNMTPLEWMTETYNECNNVFKSFNGTMILSAVMALIDESNGDMYYWNAEHPFTVLCRDGETGFLEDSLQLRKLGLDSEIPFRVRKFKLLPGDTVIMASDGRDDIDLTPDEDVRTINEDENMFLEIVSEANSNIDVIIHLLKEKGTITDDLSILKINYNPQINTIKEEQKLDYLSSYIEINPAENEDSIQKEPEYTNAVNSFKQGNLTQSLDILKKMIRNGNREKKILRLCGLLAFKLGDYRVSEYNLNEYNKLYNKNYEVLYFLTLSRKKLNDFHGAIDTGIDLLEMQSDNMNICLYLADLYRNVGKEDISIDLLNRVLHFESDNQLALNLLSKINTLKV
jgi:HAMP domain-containing protein